MTPRRAWALLILAAAGLALTPLAGLAAALVGIAACGALCGLAALAQRDTLREARIASMEARLTVAEADKARVATMWREYTAHGGT